jgi:hypothetical protein
VLCIAAGSNIAVFAVGTIDWRVHIRTLPDGGRVRAVDLNETSVPIPNTEAWRLLVVECPNDS